MLWTTFPRLALGNLQRLWNRIFFPILAQFTHKTSCFPLILTFSLLTHTVEKSRYTLYLICKTPYCRFFFLGVLAKRFPSPSAGTSVELELGKENPEQNYKVPCGHLAQPRVRAKMPQSPGAPLHYPHQPHPSMDFIMMSPNSANNSSYINT